MNSLDLIVFNVGHGLSVALIERPENYVCLIDLGADEKFSPYTYLWANYKVFPDVLYITHPHGDHITDIDSVLYGANQPLSVIYQEYDWKDIIAKEKPSLRGKLETYVKYAKQARRAEYSGNGNLRYWYYPPESAKENFEDSSYINNSSFFIVYRWRGFKIAIPGDLHSDAMEEIINNDGFKNYAEDSDILIAPHHGHGEGFTPLWPEKIGRPSITLVSVQEADPSVATQYSSSDFAKGINFDNEKRYMLSTRQEGSICVKMYYDAADEPTWNFDSF